MPVTAIPDVGLGTYDSDPGHCRASVRTALETGYRHVDTAERYGNEWAVGEALAGWDVGGEGRSSSGSRTHSGDRDEVFVSTKVHSANLGYDDVLESARASCERLGVDTIDLLYVHRPVRTYDPAETLAAFDELRDRGRIRHVGLSNFTPELLAEARDHLDTPLFAHRVECHPLLHQEALREDARERDYYLVAYSPLAKRRVFEVPELCAIAEKHGVSAAQVSLAWLLSKENVVVVPKATSPAHVRENFEARRLTLDDEDVERIDAVERTDRQVDFAGAPWN